LKIIRKALFIGIHDWLSPIKVGTHHLAECLSQKENWEVLYISLPLSPFHKLSNKSETRFNERFKIYRSNGIRISNSLISYVPYSLLVPNNKPLCKTNYIFKHWYKFAFSNILKKIEEFGFKYVDLLYFDNPVYSFLLDKISYNKSVFRVADNHKEFKGYTEVYGKFEKDLINKVDLVLYTAKKIGENLDIKKEKKMYFPNGVRFDHFQIDKERNMIPQDLKGIRKPICIYIGAIKEWFDYELINYSAKLLKGMSFVFIGPNDGKDNKIAKLNNVFFLGAKPFKYIPYYLHAADIGIIPFNVKEYGQLINSVNPLKLYEYMACGLPVVATYWEELAECQSPAFLSKNYEEFVDNLKLASKLTQDSKKQFISYAQKNDWSNKLDILLEYLDLKP